VESTDKEEGDDSSSTDNTNSKVEEDAVGTKLDWKLEATIQEAERLETMIKKVSLHVKKARDMQQKCL
jgi:hypothetical protein